MKRNLISTALLGLGSGTLALGLIACASTEGQALVANTAVVQGANDKGARVAQSIDVALVALSNVAGQLSSTGAMR